MGKMFFISVHSSNLDFAHEIKKRITAAGFLGWVMDDISGGDGWKAEVDNAINESLGVIVIVTPASMASHWVTYEWAYAMGRDKGVVPVILEWPNRIVDPKSLHDKLADLQYRDFSQINDLPWDILLSDLRRIRDRTDIPDQIKHAEETLQNGHDPAQWENALDLLWRHPHPQATEALVRCMANPVDRVSARSAMTLAQKSKYQDERAIPKLGHALKSAELAKYQKQQIEIGELLAQYGTEDAINCVIDALRSGGIEVNHRRPFVEIVARFDFEGVVDYMIDMLSQSDIVNIATNTLGRIKDPRALPFLHDLVVESKWPIHRSFAANAIGGIGSPESVGLLLGILRNYKLEGRSVTTVDSEIVGAVARALYEIGNEEALSGLKNLANDYSVDQFVRTMIQRVRPI
ncbi:MAG: toll/interleukin-1 receptor domain-containing protein [Anaerolineae bacterium]|nr:toll/interleukin-1 receptor domain-containing protein [Anaerolineae bacterium]